MTRLSRAPCLPLRVDRDGGVGPLVVSLRGLEEEPEGAVRVGVGLDPLPVGNELLVVLQPPEEGEETDSPTHNYAITNYIGECVVLGDPN